VAGGQKHALVLRPGTDQRKLIGSGGAESGPSAYDQHLFQAWHVLLSPLQHAHQNVVVHFAMLGAKLARRTDQNLASFSGLYVEGDRLAGECMRALQVSEFHELMAQKSGIAVGDGEMSLASPYFESCRQQRRA